MGWAKITGDYFVDFGAADGRRLSNTYLLESKYGWNGILAEPARRWHAHLEQNRNCHISKECVWSSSGHRIPFRETRLLELSTISSLADDDYAAHLRKDFTEYDVDTVSLLDLLDRFQAPAEIGYLSIDTEGSEYDILKTFDFELYRVRIITCEHNHSRKQDALRGLLENAGYERQLTELSDFEDWFVLKS